MSAFRAWWSRALDVVRSGRREERLSKEMQAHLELLADDFVAQGLSPADARLAARKAFGGVDQVKERYRDQRGFPLVDGLIQDARQSLRLIARDRVFSAAVVAALAVGIGATSTVASLLYGMNFRGLPFENAGELVGITGDTTRTLGQRIPIPVFEAWRATSRSFTGLSGEADAVVNIGDDENATDRFAGIFVSHSSFSLLGVRPILGRDFRADDDRAGAPPVAIIGFRMWSDRYGSDPAVLGRTIRANGQPVTVIGVMPQGFTYPIDQQVWRPLAAMAELQAADAPPRPVRIVGRLADGVGAEQARAELAAILSTLAEVPETDRRRPTLVRPLNEIYVGRATDAMPMMLLAAVVVVLLIACSHAASLMLARSSARTREISMRAALGASRVRIVRQFLLESVLLGLIAGLLGGPLAAAGASAFARETTGFGMPYWITFTFDARLTLVITTLSVLTGMLFGILPAMQLSRTNLTEVINQGGRSGMSGPRARRMTTGLLVGELAMTVVLLATAGALVQSASALSRSDYEIDVTNVWEFRLSLPQPQYSAPERRRAFYRQLDERLAAAPGMESAALASAAPFQARESARVVMAGEPLPDANDPVTRADGRATQVVAIGDRYFETLGLTLIEGIGLESAAGAAGATPALVNARFVEQFSHGVNPIGRDLTLVSDRAGATSPERITIVGIAPPIRQQIASGQTPAVYVPHATRADALASLIIRGRPEAFADVLRQEVRKLDPDLPLFNLQSLERVSQNSRFIPRMMSAVFMVVAVIATVLSALGLYAITAYAAARRTQEVGVRVALGATRAQVSWLFVRRGLAQVSAGLALGLAGAVAVGALLQSVLVDVRVSSAWSLVAVSGFLVAVAAVATWLPARRASRLDPISALRQE